MTFQIRPFTMEDYVQVMALWTMCDGIGISRADSMEGIQAFLERNPGLSFVATDGDRIVGAVLCGHDGRRGYLHHLAVHEKWRRQGIGRRLVEECLAGLAREGIQKCHALVRRENQDGMEFWKSEGWVRRRRLRLISKGIEEEAVDTGT